MTKSEVGDIPWQIHMPKHLSICQISNQSPLVYLQVVELISTRLSRVALGVLVIELHVSALRLYK
jgi:hypothetical protein